MKAMFGIERKRQAAFTLIELLVVIGIVAVLGTAVVLVLNPAELIKQSRDATRLSNLQLINSVLGQVKANNPDVSFGSANTVYISIPDEDPTCANTELPALPSGWIYKCKDEASYLNIDGTGWLPVDLTQISGGSAFSRLPSDPINSTASGDYFLMYAPGPIDSWELAVNIESEKYSSEETNDGGDDNLRFELGSRVNALPKIGWSYNFSGFPTAADDSGSAGFYLHNGTPVISNGSESGVSYARIAGFAWYIWQENIPYDPGKTYTTRCRVRQVTDPSSGGKQIYCGLVGVAADGVTLLNVSGSDNYGSQHYHTASGVSLSAGGSWSEYVGYTTGYGTPNGSSGPCSSPSPGCRMYNNVAYVRPMFIINYSAGNGIADIDYLQFVEY